MTDVNQTYCADQCAIHKNIESLCFIPETNILYVNYTSIKKKKKKKTTASSEDLQINPVPKRVETEPLELSF